MKDSNNYYPHKGENSRRDEGSHKNEGSWRNLGSRKGDWMMNTPEEERRMMLQANDGKLPPYNKEIEQSVVGALINKDDSYLLVLDILTEEMFFDDKTRTVYQAVMQLVQETGRVELCAVVHMLQRMGKLDEIGGAYTVASMAANGGTGSMLKYESKILRELFLRRELEVIGVKIQSQSTDLTITMDETIAELTVTIDRLTQGLGMLNGVRGMPTLVDEALLEVKRLMELGANGLVGMSTGLDDLNLLTGGLRGGELCVLAARPSIGKTATMLHFAMAAAEQGRKVLVYSAEMSAENLVKRCFLRVSDVRAEGLRLGSLSAEEFERLSEQAHKGLSDLPILIDDTPGMSMIHIHNSAKIWNSKGLCDAVFIDYLQLTDMACFKKGNREQEVAAASRMAKQMAREMNCPVVLLCQLNRKLEDRGMKARPMLSDLRESGAIEQDADVVMLLDRPIVRGLMQDPENQYPTERLGMIYVAKNRNGATGTVYFEHDETLMRVRKFTPPAKKLADALAATGNGKGGYGGGYAGTNPATGRPNPMPMPDLFHESKRYNSSSKSPNDEDDLPF